MKFLYIDFEFRGVSERNLDLVCMAAIARDDGKEVYRRNFWLFKRPAEQRQAVSFIRRLVDSGYVLVSYVMEAEARSILSMAGGEALLDKAKDIDLYLEYRCLLNHNKTLAYGEQYIDGKVVRTSPPPSKYDRVEPEEGEGDAHHKPSYSLAAALFKLANVKIDSAEKDEVRNLIIHGTSEDIQAAADRIQRYCMSDVEHLPALTRATLKQFHDKGISVTDWLSHAFSRGDYAVRTAQMLRLGYPVNMEKIGKFEKNVHNILAEAAKECIDLFPDKATPPFVFDRKFQRYSAVESAIRAWVEKQGKPKWRTTGSGKLSLSKDAFNDWYDSQSDGFAGAYCRYLKTKQSLNGFMPSNAKGKKRFSDFVGSDNRVRPFFGIYGSQSARSQPGAVGFIPLKSHWMRNFIEAGSGRALAGADFASQEFLISAIISQDKAMMSAYASGDVYLTFAKQAGLAPATATKESHKKVRDMAKALVLGISYDMSAAGLAPRLSSVTGEYFSKETAEGLIKKFFDAYPKFAIWKERTLREYESRRRLMLPDGWTMWGDNDNKRSVGNFPIQGHGSVIMREAVKTCQDIGLDVIFTLHDAIYIEFDSYETGQVVLLRDAMELAFDNVMKRYGHTIPIRIEGEVWSKDYAERMPDKLVEGFNFMTEYVDGKGKAELERFRKYWDD